MKPANISITPSGKCPEDVKGLSGLVVGVKHAPGFIAPCFLCRGLAINDVTTVAGELLAVHHLERLRARPGREKQNLPLSAKVHIKPAR